MWVKADLHIHSTFSDGKPSPREIITYSIYKDLKIISITDHNTFSGSVNASNLLKNTPGELLVIIGNEVKTDKGDILLYCREPIDTPHNLDKLIEKAHDNDCLIVPAHPFDVFRQGIGEEIYGFRDWSAVEVWNASANQRANKKAFEAAKILGLPGLANSDAHVLEYIGVAYTYIEVRELSVEEFFKAIRDGRVKPHAGYPPFRGKIKRVLWSIGRRIV